jgi:hypothetical protein
MKRSAPAIFFSYCCVSRFACPVRGEKLQRANGRVSPHGGGVIAGLFWKHEKQKALPRWKDRPYLRIERKLMSIGTILIVLLILMLLGVLPTWPHSRNWGYGPSGGLGLVLLILIVLLLMGRI